jgi:CubicO group peptidase (beta-lactamase class C family)
MGKFDDLTMLLKDFTERPGGPAGCGCAVTKDGKTVYENYCGYADLDSKKPIDADTIYSIWSMTKVIVCAAALILFERGKYLLDDPLYEYFPEYRNINVYKKTPYGDTIVEPANNPMLVKHAFTMAVGIPYQFGSSDTARDHGRVVNELKAKYGKYNLRDHIKAVSQIPIAFEPGTHWVYGFGHELVAGLIEVTSGKTVGQFLKDEIFDPLGMDSTGYRFFNDIEKRRATYYKVTESGKLEKASGIFDEYHKPDAIYEGGGGGLFSSVPDYLKFSRLMANGGEYEGVKILGRKTIDLMRTNHLNADQMADFYNPYNAGYGYGLGVRTLVDKAAGHCNGSLGEFGWTGGSGTWTLIDPAENLSIVYMHQLSPNKEIYHHYRVRAAVYGCI